MPICNGRIFAKPQFLVQPELVSLFIVWEAVLHAESSINAAPVSNIIHRNLGPAPVHKSGPLSYYLFASNFSKICMSYRPRSASISAWERTVHAANHGFIRRSRNIGRHHARSDDA